MTRNFHPENIPEEMKRNKQWVLFVKEPCKQDEHPRKTMISVTGSHWHKAKSTDPNDWETFDKAYEALNKSRYDGMVYCLSQGIVFIDIDNSIGKDGTLSPFAKEMLDLFPDTYAERSCSGHGIHIFLKGELPEDAMKRNDALGLEVYQTKRFACMTGDILSKTKELVTAPKRLELLVSKYLGRREPMPTKILRTTLSLSDQEVIQRALNSRSGEKIRRLYSGDITGYPSHSNADMAFIGCLAFWTQDPSQLDSLMRSSGLMREKWDEKHGEMTYGEITIQNALRSCHEVYKGKDAELY